MKEDRKISSFLNSWVTHPLKFRIFSYVFSTYLKLPQANHHFSHQLKAPVPLFKVQVNFQHGVLYLNTELQGPVTGNPWLLPRREEIPVPPADQDYILNGQSLILAYQSMVSRRLGVSRGRCQCNIHC